MSLIAQAAIGVVALLHFYFMVLEMFLWDKKLGMKVFGNTPEKAKITKVLAMNQGLYNGFLAAGLVWAIYLGSAGRDIGLFFLGCVVMAGIFGAITVSRKILFVQGLPAAVAMALLLISGAA